MDKMINSKEELEHFLITNWNRINAYIDEEASKLPIPVYSSIDIRESVKKFAPVDHNIYPAGFNNLCDFDLTLASSEFKKFILEKVPTAQKVGLITESNTKNSYYLDHLFSLRKCLEQAGFKVTFISFDPEIFGIDSSLILTSFSNHEIVIEKITEDEINQRFDFVIMNHDQSIPLNVDWKKIKAPIHPSPYIGWFNRSKTNHFVQYEKVINKFAKEFKINPDLMMAKFHSVENIDFIEKLNLEGLAEETDKFIAKLEPNQKVFIKGAQGTYGMGIMVVASGKEIIEMNRKTRNKMNAGKNNIVFTSVLLQESVDTIIKYQDNPAEITVYLVGGKTVGGFMRVNPLKGVDENLNSKGMVFQRLCLNEIREKDDRRCKEMIYSAIARLANLAAGLEIQTATKNI